ncbi:hypothetical protein BCV69DRAFT_196163 [Microstroma glucosiphilum]|uniref:Secreted protein n=1 Tax=Pseudomicrostroma glucosiphilum TaxID=1684307 RepID=A0A316U600_9BASI|nr:hypothetical protein BCV69DRAFT_196163 [Pseudomicrostroma glucosiphilum]PWN20687.1 hypothetical protein BCV69DRAFT_196163 [Pseudomicrostroma glucosiphilum]
MLFSHSLGRLFLQLLISLHLFTLRSSAPPSLLVLCFLQICTCILKILFEPPFFFPATGAKINCSSLLDPQTQCVPYSE